MIKKLQDLNPDITFFDVTDKEFATYGKVISGLDVSDITKAAKKISNNITGSAYYPSVAEFECLPIAKEIRNEFFGTLPAQIGYCHGHNNLLNATEWHFSSEINIAVTPIVLILGHIWEVEDNKIDVSKFKAFYLPAGTAVEVYATTLHYCPCEVEKGGFGCVVGLPGDTNTALKESVNNPLIYQRNKWIISHPDNKRLVEAGAIAGIKGKNIGIKY